MSNFNVYACLKTFNVKRLLHKIKVKIVSFAKAIRFVWKAHRQWFFEQTLVLDEIVIN
ncbi:hypothetical protein RO3G_00330 [Rhizopus delemar RA 99-880]|uniref:Uncharacterized protein n=1 Tax=Rhizopus delemar (strain RA 99-880 / ATCC MYA-4621 / FGSC 9543 / NRRL 43880) TaxID=246409 RepID=I1BHE6_RHIO9|nr:hypothetical protein RO3G_00330 [Rhizopus delemar RA 99-880]|eukprot:EIE75626.1 hypothetical protein RO3G_00330 [Rhizopus delemar RA 99-880]